MTRYEPAIDVDALTAIDMHVHVEVDAHGHSSLPPELAEAASRYFSTDGPRPDLDSIASRFPNFVSDYNTLWFSLDRLRHLRIGSIVQL